MLAALLTFSCASAQRPDAGHSDAGRASAPDALPANAVAVIGDTVVTSAELRAFVDRDPTLTLPDAPEAYVAFWRDALQVMVEKELIRREAVATHVSPVSDTQVNDAIQQVARNAGINTSELMVAAAQEGYTEQAYREAIADQILRLHVLRRELMDAWTLQGRPEELLALFERETGDTLDLTRVATLSMILIRDDGDKVTTRKRAEAVRSRLLMGADFATLAREVSMSPHASKGGLVGEMREGDLRPEIEAEVFKLDEGGVTPVIDVEGNGFMIFKVHAMRHLPGPKGEQILQAFHAEYIARATDAFMEALKEKHGATLADEAQLKRLMLTAPE